MTTRYDAVICGAGIAGVSAACFLAKYGLKNILLVDMRPPLSLTSDHSTECYRNWWPDPEMLALMNRSIDLMDKMANESGNVFQMNRRGYLYLSANPSGIPALISRSKLISNLGAGPLRIHSSFDSNYVPSPAEDYRIFPDGADLLLDKSLIRNHYPGVTDKVVAALHVRRAGWLSAQQLGMHLLENARQMGVSFRSAQVTGIEVENKKIKNVILDNREIINTDVFVNAAGPFISKIASMMEIDLPVYSELHLKAAFADHLSVVDRSLPLMIWNDPQELSWTEEERRYLDADPETSWLTGPFPSGVHTRPEGGPGSPMILMLWEYHKQRMEPDWPIPLDNQYPEIALRGLSTMIPGLNKYLGRLPRPILDGGYYTRTRENRPLVGPLPVNGAFIIGAVSGFGIMSACAVGELLAAHITGKELPGYARAFSLDRYKDPVYLSRLSELSEDGQL